MRKNKQNLSHNIYGDRFIPTEVHKQAFQIKNQISLKDTGFSNYENLLNENILKKSSITRDLNKKIMNFTKRKSAEISLFPSSLLKTNQTHEAKITQKRRISKKAYKVLQAPNLQDNFYLKLIDWSSENQISVALENELYVWSHHGSEAVKVFQTDLGDQICSVSFCTNNVIALGNNFGEIKIIDLTKKTCIQSFSGHLGRVGSLDWGTNLLASGSKDGNVCIWDLRSGITNKYRAHSNQICGLKWSLDGKYIASGGNQNKLVVYSHEKQTQLVKFSEHSAAVKAIGWCPTNPSLLASGGGTADRHIRFFSLNSLKETFSIDTGSQVCNLAFSKISNEMVSTHGYSLNEVNVWSSSNNWQNLQGLQKVEALTGHSTRVLYLAESPDGTSIVTGAGDQTLRFWNVFDRDQASYGSSLGLQMDLR